MSAPRWRDHEDRAVGRPPPPGPDAPPFYTRLGDLQGASYRRNAFAQHTAHEAAVLGDLLRLGSGDRVLDVGCGDGRHLRALAQHGVRGVGLDISGGLLRAAAEAVTSDGLDDPIRLVRADARRPPVAEAAFDAAYCIHQGGFGTHPETDRDVVAGVARAVRRGGRFALTAFHTSFAVRHLVPGDAFDPVASVHHQVSEVRAGDERERLDLWTATYTAREITDLLASHGFEVELLRGAEPGRYDGTGLGLDDPEILVVARRSG